MIEICTADSLPLKSRKKNPFPASPAYYTIPTHANTAIAAHSDIEPTIHIGQKGIKRDREREKPW